LKFIKERLRVFLQGRIDRKTAPARELGGACASSGHNEYKLRLQVALHILESIEISSALQSAVAFWQYNCYLFAAELILGRNGG